MHTMIRSLFIWTFIGVINTFVWALIGIFLSIFSSTGKIIHFYCSVPWSRIILLGSGVRVTINGLNSIDKEKSYIYIPNHLSFFDIFALLAYLPVDFKFILKGELMRIPILGWAMRRAKYISIDRSSAAKAKKTFKEAVERIRSGASIVIFAEGTRSKNGHLQPLKRGAFYLAIESGTPIVPIAIKGTNKIMPKGSFMVKKGSITIQLGKPIETIHYKSRNMPDLIEKVTVSLKSMLKE